MSKTILLADDSLTIQKVVELTFMEEDFDVVSVSDGDHALAKLEELIPALVIADVHMPGASGYEVCSQVKALHPRVPVLLLVGTFETFDEEEASAAGADSHLKKPFDSQELLQIVEGLVGTTGGPAGEPESDAVEMAAAVELEHGVGYDISSPMMEGLDAAIEAEVDDFEDDDILPGSAEIPLADAGFDFEPDESPPTPEPVAPPVAVRPPIPAASSPAGAVAADPRLSEEDVERIARKVVEYLGEDIVREISWEVIPDLAEIVIKSRLRELEEQVD
jgi:CheY-like chemotaxis protein